MEVVSENYRIAYRFAREELRKSDIKERCQKALATFEEEGPEKGSIALQFMNKPHIVTYPEFEVYRTPREEVPIWAKIIILHYLIMADGSEPSNELITIRQLSGGEIYYPNFAKRVTQRLSREFGRKPSSLLKAGMQLGGTAVELGDAAIRLLPLPRVPMTFVIWAGDDEFPAESNALFDSTISRYLSTEDVIVLAQEVVTELVHISRTTAG